MAEQRVIEAVARLLRAQRWAVLATIDACRAPLASHVAVALETDAFVLHLSRLAVHTRNLTERGHGSLALGEADDGRPDPQTLARVSVVGAATALTPDASGHETSRAAYLARLPEAEPRFGFADFVLVRLAPQRLRYVGGFADAHTLGVEEARRVLRLAIG